MKRRMLCVLLSMFVLFILPFAGFASEVSSRIVDNAQILDPAEEASLEILTQHLRDTYEMDVVILTINSLDGKSPQDYADDYYDDNGYGCGEEASGVLLLLSMEERDWYISTCGNARYALTDYGIQMIGEATVSSFGISYDTGFRVFLNALPDYFEAYENGVPIDGYADYSGDYYHGDREAILYYEEEFTPSVFLSLIIGVIVAGISVLVMRFSMNTKRSQSAASVYMNDNSYRLIQKQDLYLYSKVTKVKRQQNNTSSGGGSSVHRSSGGRSHGGGGGKF